MTNTLNPKELTQKCRRLISCAWNFKTHVQRHRSIKAQAAEMEFAARHHISIHYDEDPVYYKNLSERLTEILESLAGNWDEKVKALRQYIEQIQHFTLPLLK